jgi:hypothetical protein
MINKIFRLSIIRGCGFTLENMIESCNDPNVKTYGSVQEGVDDCVTWPDENCCIEYKNGQIWEHVRENERVNNYPNGSRLLYYLTPFGWFHRQEYWIDIYSNDGTKWIGRIYRIQEHEQTNQTHCLWYNDNLDQRPINLSEAEIKLYMITDKDAESIWYFHRPTALYKYKQYIQSMGLSYKKERSMIRRWCKQYDHNYKPKKEGE